METENLEQKITDPEQVKLIKAKLAGLVTDFDKRKDYKLSELITTTGIRPDNEDIQEGYLRLIGHGDYYTSRHYMGPQMNGLRILWKTVGEGPSEETAKYHLHTLFERKQFGLLGQYSTEYGEMYGISLEIEDYLSIIRSKREGLPMAIASRAEMIDHVLAVMPKSKSKLRGEVQKTYREFLDADKLGEYNNRVDAWGIKPTKATLKHIC